MAKEGALLHPCHKADVSAYKRHKNLLYQVAYHMIDTLEGLRSSRVDGKVNYPRFPTDLVPKMVKPKVGHHYVWNGSLWSCNFCFLRTSSPVSLSSSRRSCIGFSPFCKFRIDSRGHNLWFAFTDSGLILFCSDCYCYGSAFPRDLRSPCRGRPSVEGSSNGFYLRKGIHPRFRVPFSKPFPLHA